VPFHDQWEKDGVVSRDVWRAAGKHGYLAMSVPEIYGGAGVDDFRFNAIVNEELIRVGASGVGFSLHNDVTQPYYLELANDEQKARWLPGIVSGELITAIAMSEPGAGSDLAGIRTTARRDGDEFVINGAKTFITNGQLADLVIVVAKTDPEAGSRGVSLLVVERDMPGFTRGRKLEKIGMAAQDTAELFFDDVRVPAGNLLGEEGMGFGYLVSNLAQERMSMAVSCIATVEAAIEWTVGYVKERTAFGRTIATFQNTAFVLAECRTEAAVTRSFVDDCMRRLVDRTLTPEDAAMAKLWTSEVQGRVIDRCLQLFGGYGYMTEYAIARAFVDARVSRIYGGSNEVMKEIIGRSMGLGSR